MEGALLHTFTVLTKLTTNSVFRFLVDRSNSTAKGRESCLSRVRHNLRLNA